MRLLLGAAAAAIALYFSGHGLSRAAVDPAYMPASTSMELLVFEHSDCTYCPMFRSSVAQRYQTSPQAASAPLRFIDLAHADTSRYGLNAPITMVPTTVLIKNGREVDRIAGYWGSDAFFKMMGYIFNKAE
jgi:hypothetical protein